MKSGNGMPGASHDQDSPDRYGRGASQPIRDIQDIIAKLEVVTKRLAFPLRAVPVPRGSADPDDSESPGSPSQS